MAQLQAVRGMKDLLPEQAVRWQWLEREFRSLAELYGFGELRTPLFEPTELFVREIGEATDVVEKEMYSFERHGDALTARPEGTAGAARAYVQHTVYAREPVTRWYYTGPMFRAERPAKGRLRQFHQVGCEVFGDAGPVADAEIIELSVRFLERVGVRETRVHLSSVGSSTTRARYRDAVLAHFEPHRSELSEDSQRRLGSNPLRILDSKDERDRRLAAEAPSVLDFLDDADRAHFDGLRRGLDALGVPYEVDPRLVRGLDYYTRTLYEVHTTSELLGAQSALCGGGRYDAMVQDLGVKQPVPAIGFAAGIERILTLVGEDGERPRPAVYLAPLTPAPGAASAALDPQAVALALARDLRRRGLYCELDGRGQSVRSMLRRADALGSALCVLLGPDELARGTLTVKDLARHEQHELALASAADELARHARAAAPAAAGAAEG
jgi:histidyl-tRNA synthetase